MNILFDKYSLDSASLCIKSANIIRSYRETIQVHLKSGLNTPELIKYFKFAEIDEKCSNVTDILKYDWICVLSIVKVFQGL